MLKQRSNCKTNNKKKTNSKKNNQNNNKPNPPPSPMEPTHITLNNYTFSRYECQIAMALKLYTRNPLNATPSDETVGVIINSLRGQVNGVSPAPSSRFPRG